MTEYIEDRLKEIEEKIDKINTILLYLARKIIEEPVEHSPLCISNEENLIEECGYSSGSCLCESYLINRYLGLTEKRPVDKLEVNRLIRKHRRNELKKRKKVKANE
jgi:hypothetical protein